MQELNMQMRGIMKEMMKKSLIPMAVRTGIFFAFIGLLQLLYGVYTQILPFTFLIFGSGPTALYIITSFAFSFLTFIIQKIYQHFRPQSRKPETPMDTLRALQRNMMITQADHRLGAGMPGMSAFPGMPQRRTMELVDADDDTTKSLNTNKDWKQKLNTNKDWKQKLDASYIEDKDPTN